ncbi:DUF2569 family protein [Neoroseomonas terrae]|uniref:DUF2569 family protein n=1 Tax=Neoroseomonas terrae TaxID=424799 RepID=UPI001BA650FA|nr:DUF2569 family protein [Neoroseomonas terrae]
MGSFSLWHWLVVLAVLAIPAALIVVAVRRAQAEGGVMTPGFKGWLFILAVAVWLTPLRGLAEMGQMLGADGAAAEHFPWLVRADLAITAVTILLSAACLVLMLRRAAAFRTVFPIAAGWIVLNFPLSIIVARFLLHGVYGVEVGLPALFEAMREDIPQWIGGVVAAVAWVFYVRRSRRVAMTFVN